MAIGNNNHNKTSTKQLSNKSFVSVVNEAFFFNFTGCRSLCPRLTMLAQYQGPVTSRISTYLRTVSYNSTSYSRKVHFLPDKPTKTDCKQFRTTD